MVLGGNERFPPSSEDEDSVPKGSQKAVLDEKCGRAQNRQGLPVLPEERSRACDGGWKSAGERHIAGLAWQETLERAKARRGAGCQTTSARY